MNQLFSCCSNTVSSPLYPTKTLPHSPYWITHNYKNLDCQPDEEFSEEKRIDFHKGLLKLINYPIDKYIIDIYKNCSEEVKGNEVVIAAYAYTLIAVDRTQEAISIYKKLIAIDPLKSIYNGKL